MIFDPQEILKILSKAIADNPTRLLEVDIKLSKIATFKAHSFTYTGRDKEIVDIQIVCKKKDTEAIIEAINEKEQKTQAELETIILKNELEECKQFNKIEIIE